MPYISITGLRLNHWRYYPRFAWNAVRSMTQAHSAPGNISAAAQKIDGVHHTLTVWEDRESMRRYLKAGAHRRAMMGFHEYATGMVCGYEADVPPRWEDVPRIWTEKGREV